MSNISSTFVESSRALLETLPIGHSAVAEARSSVEMRPTKPEVLAADSLASAPPAPHAYQDRERRQAASAPPRPGSARVGLQSLFTDVRIYRCTSLIVKWRIFVG